MPLPKAGVLPGDYAVPDVLAPNLRLVFCGTALGRQSAVARAYYANPTNLFWRTLHEVGLTKERLHPTNYRSLLDYGIGLTDLAKHHFGNDVDLPADALDAAALREKILYFQPQIWHSPARRGLAGFWVGQRARLRWGRKPKGWAGLACSCCHPLQVPVGAIGIGPRGRRSPQSSAIQQRAERLQ